MIALIVALMIAGFDLGRLPISMTPRPTEEATLDSGRRRYEN